MRAIVADRLVRLPEISLGRSLASRAPSVEPMCVDVNIGAHHVVERPRAPARLLIEP